MNASLKEAADPQVAVILLDIVLGYGSHPDPAGELAPVLHQAADVGQECRPSIGHDRVCVRDSIGPARVCPNRKTHCGGAGMILAESNAQAVRMAAAVVTAGQAGASS